VNVFFYIFGLKHQNVLHYFYVAVSGLRWTGRGVAWEKLTRCMVVPLLTAVRGKSLFRYK